jgi:hypothetical protein
MAESWVPPMHVNSMAQKPVPFKREKQKHAAGWLIDFKFRGKMNIDPE